MPRPQLTALEPRDVPAFVGPLPANVVAVAADAGGPPVVRLFNPTTNQLVGDVTAFDPSFTGGVRAAVGDVTGDGVPDLVVGAGSGGGPVVKVFDGVTGTEIRSFSAYEASFRGGVYVAVGDTRGDGTLEVLAGTGDGGGPRVRVLDVAGKTVEVLNDFFAYESTFRGGVQVAAGDLDGDGRDDLICGTGVGGGPRVRGFDAETGDDTLNLFAFESTFRNGVQVAAADLDGDGKAEVVCGSGPGGGPRVRTVRADGSTVSDFFAFDDTARGGVRVGAVDADGDGRAEILTGDGGAPLLRRFDGRGGRLGEMVPFDDDFGVLPAGVQSAHGARLIGSITAVDAAAGTVTVQLGDRTFTASVPTDARVRRNEAAATLANLLVNDRVTVRLAGDGRVLRVDALTPLFDPPPSFLEPAPVGGSRVDGVLTAVNAAARTLTVGRPNGEALTLGLPTTIALARNGADALLNAFAVGDFVELVLAADGTVTAGTATSSTGFVLPLPVPGDDGFLGSRDFVGLVSAVDATAGTVTLARPDGAQFVGTVTADTVIERNGDSVPLSAIQPGDLGRAEVGLDGTLRELNVLSLPDLPGIPPVPPPPVDVSVVAGRIAVIDQTARTITVDPDIVPLIFPPFPSPVYTVPESAAVTRNGQPAAFADLRVGDRVVVSQLAGNVQRVDAVSDPVAAAGRVTEVNADARTLTLRRLEGDTVTVTVAADAEIERNGEPVPLSGLRAGDAAVAVGTDGVAQRVFAVEIPAIVGDIPPAPGGVLTGTVTNVNLLERRLTLSTPTGEQRTVSVPAGTPVRTNLLPLGLFAVPTGSTAVILLGSEGAAVRVDVVTLPNLPTIQLPGLPPLPIPVTGDPTPAGPDARVRGAVLSVENGVFTVLTTIGSRVLVTTDPGTEVERNLTDATLTAVQPGDLVEVRTGADAAADSIEAFGLTV